MTESTTTELRYGLENYDYTFGTPKEIALRLLDRLEAAEAKLKAIGKLPRLGIDADIEEVGYVYGPRPDGPFVSWHRLQKALRGEYND